jgi:hypothetical protein
LNGRDFLLDTLAAICAIWWSPVPVFWNVSKE